MITTELDFLKSHDCLEHLIERVRQSGTDGHRIDEVERELFAGLMQIGLHLLIAFVRQAGDGDVGETVRTRSFFGRKLWKCPTVHSVPSLRQSRHVGFLNESVVDRLGATNTAMIAAIPMSPTTVRNNSESNANNRCSNSGSGGPLPNMMSMSSIGGTANQKASSPQPPRPMNSLGYIQNTLLQILDLLIYLSP
ncbi:MAG: hypothetical protein JSS49_14875 [Planctomycetes bacterium]|nr:hypothetical protein [Planctomycetota bacterium]